MTDKAMQVVRELQNYARQYARGNSLGRAIDGTARIMYMAANLIEKLSAELESDDRQYSRVAFDTIVAEGLKTEADRDAWKHRAEAAERDLTTLMKKTEWGCNFCKHRVGAICVSWDECKPEWRGPYKENEGEQRHA